MYETSPYQRRPTNPNADPENPFPMGGDPGNPSGLWTIYSSATSTDAQGNVNWTIELPQGTASGSTIYVTDGKGNLLQAGVVQGDQYVFQDGSGNVTTVDKHTSSSDIAQKLGVTGPPRTYPMKDASGKVNGYAQYRDDFGNISATPTEHVTYFDAHGNVRGYGQRYGTQMTFFGPDGMIRGTSVDGGVELTEHFGPTGPIRSSTPSEKSVASLLMGGSGHANIVEESSTSAEYAGASGPGWHETREGDKVVVEFATDSLYANAPQAPIVVTPGEALPPEEPPPPVVIPVVTPGAPLPSLPAGAPSTPGIPLPTSRNFDPNDPRSWGSPPTDTTPPRSVQEYLTPAPGPLDQSHPTPGEGARSQFSWPQPADAGAPQSVQDYVREPPGPRGPTQKYFHLHDFPTVEVPRPTGPFTDDPFRLTPTEEVINFNPPSLLEPPGSRQFVYRPYTPGSAEADLFTMLGAWLGDNETVQLRPSFTTFEKPSPALVAFARLTGNAILTIGGLAAGGVGGEATGEVEGALRPQWEPPVQPVGEPLTAAGPGESGSVGDVAADEVARAAREVARGAADKAQALLPKGPRTVSALTTNHGTVVGSSTGSLGAARSLHPDVQAALDAIPDAERSLFHGKCAEPQALSDALNEGVDPSGGYSEAVKVRRPGNQDHGEPIAPCESCRRVLDKFGVGHR